MPLPRRSVPADIWARRDRSGRAGLGQAAWCAGLAAPVAPAPYAPMVATSFAPVEAVATKAHPGGDLGAAARSGRGGDRGAPALVRTLGARVLPPRSSRRSL